MTYKEKIALEAPSAIHEYCYGGVSGCPSMYSYEASRQCSGPDDHRCTECWNREIPGTEKKEDSIDDKIDIHKIIDDAIKKKDRYVSIFFMNGHTSVYVYPLGEDGLRRWIRINSRYSKCPNCGRQSDIETPYCSMCGENLGRSEG